MEMVIKTLQFGDIDVDVDKIISFANGLPGFEHLRRFVIVNPDQSVPLYWLQSVEEPEIALTVVDPFALVPGYDLEINDAEVADLGLKSQEDLMVLSVTVIPKDIKKMTVNLVAPILINMQAALGKQVVMDNKRYSTRHPAFEGFYAAATKGGGASVGAEQKG